MTIDYKQKYLKYKNKYLELKNQLGSSNNPQQQTKNILNKNNDPEEWLYLSHYADRVQFYYEMAYQCTAFSTIPRLRAAVAHVTPSIIRGERQDDSLRCERMKKQYYNQWETNKNEFEKALNNLKNQSKFKNADEIIKQIKSKVSPYFRDPTKIEGKEDTNKKKYFKKEEILNILRNGEKNTTK